MRSENLFCCFVVVFVVVIMPRLCCALSRRKVDKQEREGGREREREREIQRDAVQILLKLKYLSDAFNTYTPPW